jgi:nitrous oxidase accessory protein NosD
VEKDGALSMYSCEIKGHETKETIGIVCRMGTLILENSTVNNHRGGGVLIWGLKENHSRIMKNIIEDNKEVGVHVVGEEFKLKIISNSIHRNGVGVRVGLACEPEVSRNLINQNKEGI